MYRRYLSIANHVWSYCRHNVGSVNTRLGCAYESRMYARGAYYLRSSPSEAVHNKHVIHVMTEFTGLGLSSIESSNGATIARRGNLCAVTLKRAYTYVHTCNGCDVNSRWTQMRTQIIRGHDSRRLRNWHLSRPRRQKQRGREWRTCLHRYSCNYGFIENDASLRNIFRLLWRILFHRACAGRVNDDSYEDSQRNDDGFNISWLLLTLRNYHSIDH